VAITAAVPAAAGGAPGAAQLHLKLIASGFQSARLVGAPRSEPGRLYVGRAARRESACSSTGTFAPSRFLDIHSMVTSGGEQGLLSVAFDPHYGTNHRFYVYFNDTNGDVRVYRFLSNGTIGLPGTAKALLRVPHREFSNHNGGQLEFGPDGASTAGTGDGGSGGDPTTIRRTSAHTSASCCA
jgi:glucose/arabinose dehydrogenase